MYCPVCKYEYQPGIEVCPDCNELLVERLPEKGAAAVTPDESWVVMGRVSSDLKSQMAKGTLDSNNIPSVILASNFNVPGKGLGFGTMLTGQKAAGNVIMVPREYFEEALFILESVLGEDLIQPEQ